MGVFLMLTVAFPNAKAGVTPNSQDDDTALDRTESVIPPAFQQRLDSLKKNDQLETWLNTWYDYLATNPKAHFNSLAAPLHAIWREPQTKPETVSWFYLLIFMGYYELQQGNILQSTDRYERAYHLIQNSDAVHDNEILEYLIKPLGNNYTRLGDYERALYIQKEGLKLASKSKDPMQEAAALANMSTTARWNDQPEDALTYARRGLQKVKPGTALQGLLYSTQADILQAMDSMASAQSAIQLALHLLDRMSLKNGSNNAYWYAGALATAGDIAQKAKTANVAEQYYRHAHAVFQKYFPHSRQREKMKIQVALGQVSLSKNQYNEGLHHFNQALSGLLPIYPENTAWPPDSILYAENTLLDALVGKARLLHMMGKDSLSLIGYQKTAMVLQKLRQTIFSREAQRLLQEQSLKTTEAAIGLAYQRYKQTGQPAYADIALQLTEQHKARLLLDDLQRSITYAKLQTKDSLLIRQSRLRQAIAYYTHAYIDAMLQDNAADRIQWKQKIDRSQYNLSLLNREIHAKYPGIGWQSNPKVSGIYRSLPAQTIVWEYFTGPGTWYAFAIGHQGILQFSELGPAEPLQDTITHFVDHWFAQGPEAMLNQPETYCNAALSIYGKLHLDLTTDGHNLIIVPDGILGRLPFEALLTDSTYGPDPARWPYLLKKAVTSQSYSLAVWYQLQTAFQQMDQAAGFAGFFINPGEDSPLASLEGVKQEEERIHQIIAGHYYSDENATAGQLLNAMQTKAVIHISTHAFLIGEQQLPALQMADKKIFLADLYPLHAHPALVVISACQTANGLLSPGEGIISLAREFTAAGAGGVIAGLWAINDETAARLTALFYQAFQKSGRKSDALYAAKTKWLADQKRDATLKLPYYWAGLVYYGNHLPLTNPLPNKVLIPLWTWLVIVLSLLLLGGVVYKLRRRRAKPARK